MGVVWGILSALAFGSADFIARGVSVSLSPYHALFYIHLVSGILLAGIVLISGIPETASLAAAGLGALVGSINTLGTLLLYRALAVGKLSVVSPIASTFGGVALVLALLTGDMISGGSIFGLVLMLVGIVMAAIVREENPDDGDPNVVKGLPSAIMASVALGINAWGLQFVVEPLGPYIPVLLGRIMTVVLLALLFKPLKQSIAVPPRKYWLRFGAMGLITTLGEVAYNVGIQGTTPGVVAILSSLFGTVTVLLALIFLHERLARHQWIGVGIIFAAILIVGIFQNLVSAA
jgi:drug/metabolite transporter (DMT)-like permease